MALVSDANIAGKTIITYNLHLRNGGNGEFHGYIDLVDAATSQVRAGTNLSGLTYRHLASCVRLLPLP